MEDDLKYFHAQIRKKTETDGNLIIEGWASTKDLDRQEEVVEPTAFTGGIDGFLKNPILLYMHDWMIPIGRVLSASVKDVEGFWIRAVISKAEDVRDIATKIREGILCAFSIGFRIPEDGIDVLDGIRHIKKLELYEISVVTIPANSEALFSVAKAMQHGSDLVIPYNQLVRDVEELKVKAAAPAGAPPITPQPVADKTTEPAPSPDPYAGVNAEIGAVLAEIKAADEADTLRDATEVLEKIKGRLG